MLRLVSPKALKFVSMITSSYLAAYAGEKIPDHPLGMMTSNRLTRIRHDNRSRNGPTSSYPLVDIGFQGG